ncbi:MAG TPA: sirohydrochlorin cobaltochelatase, partial [Lachnospiraceae bacterium]|nr:sirohydrochlorin cobaltochelatase [Lachnospiraceae bacterium]
MKKSAIILTVSFGSSSKSGAIAVQAIEEAIGKAFPDWELHRAFTCRRMIDRIREHEG